MKLILKTILFTIYFLLLYIGTTFPAGFFLLLFSYFMFLWLNSLIDETFKDKDDN